MPDVYFSLYAAKNYQDYEDENHTFSCDKVAADMIVKSSNPEALLFRALQECGWNSPQPCDVQAVLTA